MAISPDEPRAHRFQQARASVKSNCQSAGIRSIADSPRSRLERPGESLPQTMGIIELQGKPSNTRAK